MAGLGEARHGSARRGSGQFDLRAPGGATLAVVPAPNGRGDVQVTVLTAGPHADIDACDSSDSHTRSGGAS